MIPLTFYSNKQMFDTAYDFLCWKEQNILSYILSNNY